MKSLKRSFWVAGTSLVSGEEGSRLSRARTYNITVMSGTFQPIKL